MAKYRWLAGILALLMLGMTACNPAPSISDDNSDGTVAPSETVSSTSDSVTDVDTTTVTTEDTSGTTAEVTTMDETTTENNTNNTKPHTTATDAPTTKKPTKGTAASKTTVKTTAAPKKPLPSAVNVWFQDALTDAFFDTTMPKNAATSGELHAARNEYETLQVVIRSTASDLGDIALTAKPFTGKNAPTITIGEIVNVRSTRGSELMGDYCRGECPTYFPEYYTTHNTAADVKKNQTRAMVVKVYVPKNTPVGKYTTTLTLSTAQGIRTLPLSVQVHNATLPEPKDSKFSYTCWTYTAGMKGDHIDMMNDLYFDAANYNDNFWTLQKNYAMAMVEERQNVVFVPIKQLLASDLTIDENGKYHFSFKNFDKFIETYLKYGSVKSFAGCHLMEKDWYIDPGASDPSWPTHSCVTWVYYDNNGTIRCKWVYSDDAQAENHLRQMLTALYVHLKSKGWDKMWLQYVCDEVDGEKPISQVRNTYRFVKERMPTCRTSEAGSNLVEKYGSDLIVPVPRIDDYDRLKGYYDKLRDDVSELWGYTCCVPQGNFVNRMSDFPLLSTRIIGWYWYYQDLDGYLHWAWNYWDYGNVKPCEPLEEISCAGGPMDAWLVFPDIENTGVLTGTRFTAVRDGFEDNELLRMAEAKDAEKVQKLLSKLMTSSQEFERDQQKLLDARLELFKILDK